MTEDRDESWTDFTGFIDDTRCMQIRCPSRAILLDDVLRCNVGNWRRLLIIIGLDSLAVQNMRRWLVTGLFLMKYLYLGTRPETSQRRLMAPSQQLLSVIDKMATKLNTCCCGSGWVLDLTALFFAYYNLLLCSQGLTARHNSMSILCRQQFRIPLFKF